MPINARDEQVIRESILQTNASARDEQIIRESILQTSASAHDLQVFRETICILGTPTLYAICFAAT